MTASARSDLRTQRAKGRPAPCACVPAPNGRQRARRTPEPPRLPSSRAQSSSFPQPLASPIARSPAGPTSPHRGPAAGPAAHLIPRSPPRAARTATRLLLPVARLDTSYRVSCLVRPTAARLTGPLAFHSKETEAMIGSCGRRLEATGGEWKEGVPHASDSLVNLKVGARVG